MNYNELKRVKKKLDEAVVPDDVVWVDSSGTVWMFSYGHVYIEKEEGFVFPTKEELKKLKKEIADE